MSTTDAIAVLILLIGVLAILLGTFAALALTQRHLERALKGRIDLLVDRALEDEYRALIGEKRS